MESRNRFELSGTLIAIDAVRYTPAGIPLVELKISHESSQIEAGRTRSVICELAAVAAGEGARKLAVSPLGARIQARGFLAHPGKSKVRLVLHINEFEFI